MPDNCPMSNICSEKLSYKPDVAEGDVEYRPLLFSHIAGPIRDQNQPVYQVTAAASLAKNVYNLCAILDRFLEIECITHFRPLSSQILSDNDISIISEKPLTQAYT